MYQKVKKIMATFCILALVIAAIPAIPAKAATVPKFKRTYASIYENGAGKGAYTYTLTNLKKGQTVKWSVSGEGKSYVTVKKASKKAAKSTMANVIVVKTNGKIAAKNKKVTLTAQVYSTAGKRLYTVKTTAKIKVKPTSVTMTAPKEADSVLAVGKSYKFSYKVNPTNATSTNVWTVTGSDGQDYSSYMTSSGMFTPAKAGTYTIKMSSMIGSKTIKSASVVVEADNSMESLKQTAADKVEVVYSGDVRNTAKLADYSIKTSAGASAVVKDLAFSDDGKKVILSIYSTFKDGTTYSISDKKKTLSFIASVGTPVRMEILTRTVTVDKETAIEYAIYDSKGIDVTGVYEGTIDYGDPQIMNGYLTEDKKLYMTSVGKTATIKLKYTCKTDSRIQLEREALITCVAATTSANTNFTLTTTNTTPDYTAASYKDNRRAAIGSTYYAHFRALDTDKTAIKYSSVKYESTDPDTLIITSDGKVTPIRSGTVRVIVSATYAGEVYPYSFDVTISEASYLNELRTSTSVVKMSNAFNSDYRQYIDVTALDQYGESFPLTNEVAGFIDNNTYKANIATYDATENRIVLNASNVTPGNYSYTLVLTCGTKKVAANFTVTVVAVPTNGAVTYAIEIDRNTADMSLNSGITGSQYVNVRLARYRGGVFSEYMNYTTATISKGGKYYTADLTAGGSTTVQSMGSNSSLAIKTMDITSGNCRKAETGDYLIYLLYYSAEDMGNRSLTTTLKVTDTQDTPNVRIDRIKSTKTCASALELAKNCISLDEGGITECEVTGASQPGSKVEVKSGDQINIKSVTAVKKYTISGGQEITVTYTISVGKTLTNI